LSHINSHLNNHNRYSWKAEEQSETSQPQASWNIPNIKKIMMQHHIHTNTTTKV
jgi:hypothetical protein